MSQLNPYHTLEPQFFGFHFNIIRPCSCSGG